MENGRLVKIVLLIVIGRDKAMPCLMVVKMYQFLIFVYQNLT
jgi:hypothetical protein